ncbi:hypothetical protein GGI15_000724 [Coemansia interrupta]|uniref:Uncharacterized protein n=1 Tax=Coemansia interrupta TaxID=1126814 RepID=A0A9W8LP99_9FUNG|nr:hypothetical protein GGI15_000724 [Coemansia interrupta]
MADKYVLEQRTAYEGASGSSPYPVHVYKHKQSEFRVVVCPVPGLVCNMSVCMPTPCSDHKGTPHTLEHLVFCGSEKYPYRGYLDALASHNLGQPLNASTHKDMTLYKFVGLCQEGAANVLPAVLDHIMHPIIQDNHFATEVYHVDQEGRQQGVVLSEMSDYSYKEESVRSLSLERMLYQESSTYAWEQGGLPQVIETLTRDEVVRYHAENYSYSNATLFLVGAFDEHPVSIFEALDKVDADICASPPPLKRGMPPLRAKREKRRMDLVFASGDSHAGSMGFAWEGPPIEDVECLTALEMLLDYLESDPASPLRMRFTNRPVPIANDVKFSLWHHFPTMIELSFTEVPFASYISHAAAAAAAATTTRRNTYSSASYPSPANAFGPLDLAKLHDDTNSLFAPNYYRKQLVSTLTYIADYWLADHWVHFRDYMTKRVDTLEATFKRNAVDDKHANGLLQMLSRDAVAYHFSPGSIERSAPNFGTRSNMFSMRRQLIKDKPLGFWEALVQKWLLDSQMAHIAMIPDPKMRIQIEAERNLAQRNRIEKMTPGELAAMQQRVAEAIATTKICIPQSVLNSFPEIPDMAKVQIPQLSGFSWNLSGAEYAQSPFGIGRVLVTPSSEDSQFQISLPLAGLASDLYPYLPLFAKLITSSVGLVIPHSVADKVSQGSRLPKVEPTEMPLLYLNNEQVDSAVNGSFNECSAFIGERANYTSTGHWPVEVLTLFGRTQTSDLLSALDLLLLKLLFGDFGIDAIFKAAVKESKLLASRKGTPSSLLIDTFQWIRLPGLLDARKIAAAGIYDTEKKGVGHPASASSLSGNESFGRALNIYYQTSFMSSVTDALTVALSGDDLVAAHANRVSDSIARIRAHFSQCIAGTGMIHITWPHAINIDNACGMVNSAAENWNFYAQKWRENHRHSTIMPSSPPLESSVHYRADSPSNPHPRKKRRGVIVDTAPTAVAVSETSKPKDARTVASKDSSLQAVSPINRAGSKDYVHVSSPLGIHIALPSLHTSFVGIQLPLDIQEHPLESLGVSTEKQLESLPALDCYALRILTIIFCRSEGLMKNAIRSRGYAYGIGAHPKCEDGHLAVYISHAMNPRKALEAVWEITELLVSEEGWNDSINDFQLNLARSTLLFRCYSGLTQSLASEDAFALFRGFSGIEQYLLWMRKHVESVTVSDLRRVFLRYFAPLVSKDKPESALYIVATPSTSAEPYDKFSKELSENPYGIEFRSMPFATLDPKVDV